MSRQEARKPKRAVDPTVDDQLQAAFRAIEARPAPPRLTDWFMGLMKAGRDRRN